METTKLPGVGVDLDIASKAVGDFPIVEFKAKHSLQREEWFEKGNDTEIFMLQEKMVQISRPAIHRDRETQPKNS